MESPEQISFTRDSDAWRPSLGQETNSLLAHLNLPPESQQRLITETAEILSKCGNPQNTTNNEIGLVFGYVQSGKTMSFTALTALSKDNGYRIIIIIAGISTNLVEQSFTRLEKDLRIDQRTDLQWLSFRNPKVGDITTRNQIATALNEYRDPTFPRTELKTILITVMKQRNHLPNLQSLLQTLDLNSCPTLIIDDEGDQHSMNRFARQNAGEGGSRRSPIYERIINLRNIIPHHTFIQYTATPQAPLFIDIVDALSPNFIQLLTPGPEYTGGNVFFGTRPELTVAIDDLDTDEDPTTPPSSLVYAMQIFFLGVVKGLPMREGKKRSMMIHPSQLTYTHNDYFRFATNIQRGFVELLSLDDGNPDKIDLLAEFRVAYDDLLSTTNDLPSFQELSNNRLRHAINSTVIQSLNSQGGNRTIVDWRNNYSFILVGGQAMDRGFTVEGLTVSYMPRSVGVGNADTIQQRARFFGYKQSYLGYCRVYLDEEARHSYQDYIEHEEDMRRRLASHLSTGRHLNEWYREVLLSSDMNLARPNVFSHEFERSILGGDWFTIKRPQFTHHQVESNRNVVDSFIANHQFDRTGNIPVLVAPLNIIYEELLVELRFPGPGDAGDYATLVDCLEKHMVDNPENTATIYLMSESNDPRVRALTDSNTVNQLFQGRSGNYPGDRLIKASGITFQIHYLNLSRNDVLEFEKVASIAANIPEEIGKEIIRWSE